MRTGGHSWRRWTGTTIERTGLSIQPTDSYVVFAPISHYCCIRAPWSLKSLFWCASRTAIHVFIDEASPTVSHSIVHELCHGILMGEGYHRLTGDQLRCRKFVRDVLSNEFQHPEVYRRMGEFGLDMPPYWERCRADLRRGLEDILNDREPQDAGFWYFPRLYSWLFIPHLSKPILEEYRAVNQRLWRAVLAAYEETKDVGFHTAERHLRCLGIFKRHWLRHCIETLPMDFAGQSKIFAIGQSVTKAIANIVASQSEEDLIAHLKVC
jgi:hypothetical protein